MGSENWKGEMQQNPNVAKRIPNRVRNIPHYYFLPKWSLPSAFVFCTGCIAGGIAAGMLVEACLINNVKDGGGVIWEFDK